MTITGGGDSYTVTCDLVTAEGCNVTASYTGSIALTDSSGETGDAVSTLTGDYTLDLDGATAEASFYGDYYGTGGGNWTISILPTTGPDGLLIDLVAGRAASTAASLRAPTPQRTTTTPHRANIFAAW